MKILSALLVMAGCMFFMASGSAIDEAGMLEDNEFAEFEQFDADEDIIMNVPPAGGASLPQFNNVDEVDEDILVEDEDNEFEHFQDPEEFEGFADDAPNPAQEQPKITITKMPIMVRARWEAYWAEGLLALGLALYAVNFLTGRSKNFNIATAFSAIHKPFLQENFTLVGEEGSADTAGWKKEAEHVYTMWCSGRTCCEGMLLTLKLIKRQDLVHLGIGLIRPTLDNLLIRINMGKEDLDNFVLCVAQKKAAVKLAKEMQDLSVYCGEKRPGEKFGLPDSFSVLSEIGEPCQSLLDTRVCTAFHRYGHLIDYIHISDQYSGPKQTEETSSTKLPECQRVMLFSLVLPVSATSSVDAACEAIKPMIALVFYMLEKVKRYNLSVEASQKTQKNRQNVEEAFLKSTHAARQQLAAQKREDKRRLEKDRIMAEEDPEKQRRWEKKEMKRQMKKKAPKMKQLKVKSM